MSSSLRPVLIAAALVLASCSAPTEAERPGSDLRTVGDGMIGLMAPDAAELCKAHPWAVAQRLDDEHILFERDIGSGVYVYEYSLYRQVEDDSWALVGKGCFSTSRLYRFAVIKNSCLCFIDSEGQTIHRMKITPPRALHNESSMSLPLRSKLESRG